MNDAKKKVSRFNQIRNLEKELEPIITCFYYLDNDQDHKRNNLGVCKEEEKFHLKHRLRKDLLPNQSVDPNEKISR